MFYVFLITILISVGVYQKNINWHVLPSVSNIAVTPNWSIRYDSTHILPPKRKCYGLFEMDNNKERMKSLKK